MAASNFEPAAIPPLEQDVNGTVMVTDTRGRLVPKSTVRPMDLLMDQTVRKIAGYHIAASDQIARLKQHTFEDIEALAVLVAEQYGAKIGGARGNMTMTSHDGLFKVVLQVADLIQFGPELQAANDLFNQCCNDWAEGSRAELRMLVSHAFNTDRQGQINRAEIFRLLRVKIEDERWENAQEAIRDAMRVVGTREYVRCYQRASQNADWKVISTDMAKV